MTCPSGRSRWSDQQVERLVGRLLQIGSLASAVVVAAGGVIYLAQRGGTLADFHAFRGEPERLRHIAAIAVEAVHLHARGMIQFGLVLLVFTPICRVALTAAIFLFQRDYVFAGYRVSSYSAYCSSVCFARLLPG